MKNVTSAEGGSAFGGKKYTFIVAAILLLAAGCGKQVTENNAKTTSPISGGQNSPESNSIPNFPPVPKLPVFSGVLENSDNLAKGNLMLVVQPDQRSGNELSTSTKMYIQTQRDFSSLIGKKVLVDFIGDKDNFHLADIVEDNGNANTGPFKN